MSLSLLHQQSRACLVHLTWMVCETRSSWLYNCCFLECYFKDLFKTASICNFDLAFLFQVFCKSPSGATIH